MEPFIALDAVAPERRFVGVEWIIGHHHRSDSRLPKDVSEMIFQVLSPIKLADGLQRCVLSPKACKTAITPRVASDSGEILDEQRLPDQVGALRLVQLPVLLGCDTAESKQFGLHIVISEKFVDAPKPQAAELGWEQMRVNVDELRGIENVLDSALQLFPGNRLSRRRRLSVDRFHFKGGGQAPSSPFWILL